MGFAIESESCIPHVDVGSVKEKKNWFSKIFSLTKKTSEKEEEEETMAAQPKKIQKKCWEGLFS